MYKSRMMLVGVAQTIDPFKVRSGATQASRESLSRWLVANSCCLQNHSCGFASCA